MALRMSFASLLPAFHASLPAVLPAPGPTFVPTLKPALAAFTFLLAIAYLHPGEVYFLETPRYPEWHLRKQPQAPTPPLACSSRPRHRGPFLQPSRPPPSPRRYPRSRAASPRTSRSLR